MKEALFKIILLIFLLNISYSLNEYKYIHKDIVPFDSKKTYFGLSLYDYDDDINGTLLLIATSRII